MTKEKATIVLGIDPGTVVSGYGVLEKKKSSLRLVDFGVIRPPKNLPLFDRYYTLHRELSWLMEQYRPSVMSIETQFMYKNAQSALKLGMARGVAIVAAKACGADCVEYSPTEVKKAVVGRGRASKLQVQDMIKRRFALSTQPPEDAADALAIALCYCQKDRNRGIFHV